MAILFKKKSGCTNESLVKRIDSINARDRNVIFQYFYLVIVELVEGGYSFVNIGGNDFLKSNYKMLRGEYKNIIDQIHKIYKSDMEKLLTLQKMLLDEITETNFKNYIHEKWYRFLFLKSLHDATLMAVDFDIENQNVTLTLNSRNAIDKIPFNEVVELEFKVADFNPDLDEMLKLKEYISRSISIIFGVTLYFKDGYLRVNIDYDCYNDVIDDETDLLELDFRCKNCTERKVKNEKNNNYMLYCYAGFYID